MANDLISSEEKFYLFLVLTIVCLVTRLISMFIPSKVSTPNKKITLYS